MTKSTARSARSGRLPRSFFSTKPELLAPALLGQRLVRILPDGHRLAGLIVETEAYLGVEDRAAHSFGGRRTDRVRSMYMQPGTAYVYFTYGMHYCFNVVCGQVDEPVAVLIRALEPIEGLDVMRRNRTRRGKFNAHQTTGSIQPANPGKARRSRRDTGGQNVSPPHFRDRDLCSGPAKLCQALSIDRALDGIDLVHDARFFIETAHDADVGSFNIGQARRIGVDYAGDWAHRDLRWFIRGNPNVSKHPPGS